MTTNFERDTPLDRTCSFQSKLVKKNHIELTDEIDHKILSMFLLGMSYRDICGHVEDMYDIDVSEAAITGVTVRLIPELECQQRPLDALYPFVWLDDIHTKITEDGRCVSKVIYTILGLTAGGKRNCLASTYLNLRGQLLAVCANESV